MSGDRVAKERLYRTVDGKVVSEGDDAAAFLLAIEGEGIPDGYDVPKSKMVAAPVNKAATPDSNKSTK